jgi:type IX secretion system PorP/SprF family membrane protein
MKSYKLISFVLVVLAFATSANAQQEAMYTQMVYNKQHMNPAYVGYREVLNVTASHRSQWVGFKGAPNTQIISFETPLKVDELAMGAGIMHDKIGPTRETQLSVDFSYRLRLVNRATLAFGAKASVGLYQANLVDVDLTSDYYGQEDEYFMTNPKSAILPNAGFGVYYYSKKYYISLSSPKMIRNKRDPKGYKLHDVLFGKTEPTVYFMAGYSHKINREYKLQPNIIAKGVANSPVSVGLLVNLIYMDQLYIGAYYNFKEVAGALIQWQVDKKWKIGYALDFATNEMIRTNYGSHEIMVNYSVGNKRKRIVYPRYF